MIGHEAAKHEDYPTLADVERKHIEKVLTAMNGHRTKAAKILGIDRKTLYRKLVQYRLDSTNG